MNNNLKSALASVQLEGEDFSFEQVKFISELVNRVNNGEITWDKAIEIIKNRHKTNTL